MEACANVILSLQEQATKIILYLPRFDVVGFSSIVSFYAFSLFLYLS
jgi:hypothetical protein